MSPKMPLIVTAWVLVTGDPPHRTSSGTWMNPPPRPVPAIGIPNRAVQPGGSERCPLSGQALSPRAWPMLLDIPGSGVTESSYSTTRKSLASFHPLLNAPISRL
jgi:hypothetical protein